MAGAKNFIVRGGADFSELEKKLTTLQKNMKKASKNLGSIGSSLTRGITVPVTAAVASLGALVASSVQEAADAQAVAAQLDAVLTSTGSAAGVTAKQAQELASALQNTTKFEDDATLAAENMLLTFTNIKKDVFPDTIKTTLDMATALGTDATSAAMTLGKALNDPVKGVSRLTKVGVTFTDAQKEQIKQMQAAGDVAGAQKVILQELQKEFGGSAEAAGKTFAGQLEILKNQFSDVKEELGTALMPSLQEFMKLIQDNMPEIKKAFKNLVPILKDDLIPLFISLAKTVAGVFKWFANLNPKTQETIGKFLLLAAALGPILTTLSKILSIGSGVAGAIKGIGIAAGVSGAAGGVGAFGTALSVLAGPAGWIALTIAGLGGLVYWFNKTTKAADDARIAANKADPNYSRHPGTSEADFNKLDESSNTRSSGGKTTYNAEGGIFASRTTLFDSLGNKQVFGEAGPEALIPLDKMQGGSNVVINVTGNTIASDYDVEKIGTKLAGIISRENRRIANRASLIPIG